MSRHSTHAIQRAQERYDLNLSPADCEEIVRACNDGRAEVMQCDGDSEVFVWRYAGRIVIPVLVAGRKYLVTFLPQDHFTAGRALRRSKGKQVPRVGHGIDGCEYRRQEFKREGVREANEAISGFKTGF